jgi:hypothetical protein
VQRVRGRVDVGWSGGHRELLLTGDGAGALAVYGGHGGRTVYREHAPLYGQRRQMWQVRSGSGEVWQMGSRRDPDLSALAVFADELRAQRERAGLGRDELAGRLNYSASLISMIESGHRSPVAGFRGPLR